MKTAEEDFTQTGSQDSFALVSDAYKLEKYKQGVNYGKMAYHFANFSPIINN